MQIMGITKYIQQLLKWFEIILNYLKELAKVETVGQD